MANEIEEVRYQVGEAWKGEYNAATPYGVAAVVQDPTGLSIYRSLKNGNTGHPLTDTNWWFCIIDMSSIKQEGDALEALDEQVTENEAARAAAENERSSAEQGRQSAESARATAESNRASAESGRVNAENARVTAENARAAAETSRVNAEAGRVSAEEARVLSENLRDSAESARAIAENNRAAAETERHTQYTADHSAATSDHATAQLDHTTAVADHEQATADHTASVEATGEASNVNAQIEGMTVTITDRNGQSHSVNIGFDIAGTYGSVAAMNADAANVQEGAFVMIATLDPTSQENARLYVRNSTAPTSSEPFTFLSDLDQAATSAWADWMENYKPTIIADHQRAETDHTTAAADHTAAVSDHNTATTDHTQAASDHNTAASDHTAAASDHTRAAADHTTAAADHTQAESDHQRAETDHNTMEPRIANLEENKANKDGYYSQMTVGAAETLVGETIDSADYLIRPTGGSDNEVANGAASVIGMEGHTEKFNQLVTLNPTITINGLDGEVTVTVNNDGSYTLNGTTTALRYFYVRQLKRIVGHKVFYSIGGDFIGIFVGDGYGASLIGIGKYIKNADGNNIYINIAANTTLNNVTIYPQIIDLTAIFGAGNEPSTVAEFEAWLAKNVGLKPYYGYNAGSLLSAQTLGVKTYGQNLLNPITRQARLIPYDWEENSNVYTLKNVPSGATATFTPDATGVAETVDISGGSLDITSYGRGVLELSAATSETYVCMKWDEGKDDDVVPFEEHTQTFDVRKVYGKVNGAGEYVQCFPNGLRGIRGVKDSLTADSATKVIGDVDLGTLSWSTYEPSYGNIVMWADVIPEPKRPYNGNIISSLICTKYRAATNKQVYDTGLMVTGNACIHVSLPRFYIYDSAYTDAAAFKAAMSGVPLYYELATPITYTDLVYRDGGIDTPIVDVLFNIDVDNWSIEEQLLTPYDEDGNPTSVPAKISTNYGMDAVEEIDTIKHTYVSAYNEQEFSDSQKAQARRNIGAVEENGTYPNMSVGIAKNLAGENAVEAEYTYRPSNGTIGTATGIANVTDVKGETLVWNQMLQNGNFTNNSGWVVGRGTLSVSNNVATVTQTTYSQYGLEIFTSTNIAAVIGHKYFLSVGTKANKVYAVYISGKFSGRVDSKTANVWNTDKFICTAVNGAAQLEIYALYADDGENTVVSYRNVQVIDLTLMFGAGKEPSTVAEFEALYPLDYYDYNAGTLVNNNASAIETIGFNQWDEEWEVGAINTTTGEKVPSTTSIRSVNDIPVLPNTDYYFQTPRNKGVPRIAFLDANHKTISTIYSGIIEIITTPSNCHYIRFSSHATEYGTTYNHDICINISDPAKNGTYEPYEKHTFYFDKVLQGEGSLATIKGKLNGEGESVVVFPDGLRKAGNVFDEIKGNVAIKRIGSVDLGSLTWTYDEENAYFFGSIPNLKQSLVRSLPLVCAKYTSISDGRQFSDVPDKSIFNRETPRGVMVIDSAYTDAATFKTAMQGVKLIYELATPETYILDQTVTGGYQVNANGTERRLPEDTASSVNAPVNYSVIYPINAVGTLIKLPVNYISEKSLTNFTTELASKLGTFLNATIGISATYNQTNQEYDYSITITANQ